MHLESLLGILVATFAVLWTAIVGIFPFAWDDLAHALMCVLFIGWAAEPRAIL